MLPLPRGCLSSRGRIAKRRYPSLPPWPYGQYSTRVGRCELRPLLILFDIARLRPVPGKLCGQCVRRYATSDHACSEDCDLALTAVVLPQTKLSWIISVRFTHVNYHDSCQVSWLIDDDAHLCAP